MWPTQRPLVSPGTPLRRLLHPNLYVEWQRGRAPEPWSPCGRVWMPTLTGPGMQIPQAPQSPFRLCRLSVPASQRGLCRACPDSGAWAREEWTLPAHVGQALGPLREARVTSVPTRKDWKSWKEPTSQTYRWECTLVEVPLKVLATTRKE